MVKDKEIPSETMASMPFKHYLPGEYKRGDLWFEDFVDDVRAPAAWEEVDVC